MSTARRAVSPTAGRGGAGAGQTIEVTAAWLSDKDRLLTHLATCIRGDSVIVGVSLAGTRRLRSEDDLKWAQTLVRWGEIIRRLSPPRASVLSPDAPDRVFQYYADRAMVFRADTVEEVRAAEVKDRGDRRPPPLFVCPRRSAGDYAEVLSYLDGKYRAQEEGGLIAYVLDARASAPAAPAAGPGEP